MAKTSRAAPTRTPKWSRKIANARAMTLPAVKSSVIWSRLGAYRLRRNEAAAVRGLAVAEAEEPGVAALLRRAVVPRLAELEVAHGKRRVHGLVDVARLKL